MDKKQLIGLGIMGLLLMAFLHFNGKSKAALEAKAKEQEAIEAKKEEAKKAAEAEVNTALITDASATPSNDSARIAQLGGTYGAFAPAAAGVSSDVVLENDKLKLTFDTKGGNIKSAIIKEHLSGHNFNKANKEQIELMAHEDDVLEIFLPLSGKSTISTRQLYFTPSKSANALTLTAKGAGNTSIAYTYTLNGDYDLSFDVQTTGLDGVIDASTAALPFKWESTLKSYEKGRQFESNLSTVYWREADGETVEHCDCTGDDEEKPEKQVDWISHTQQFFNTTIIAKNGALAKPAFETIVLKDDSTYFKTLKTSAEIPLKSLSNQTNSFTMYIGPNDYNTLKAYDKDIQNIIPYGRSFFGTINRVMIRPVYEWLYGLTGSAGWAIILLTLLVKLMVFPLTYKMIRSQTKMSLLKPMIEKIKAKYKGKDDQSKIQMETMSLYRETGVSPLGGCLPMIMQMPIWFALYRFFPATITFRQEKFLWANDLSSYDSILNFNGPFGMDHLSLFTILWAGTTLIYTWYNSKYLNVGMGAPSGGGEAAAAQMKMMKYMQYFMPVMFLFFFNGYASGLTCYLLFSNIINIIQTVGTKNGLNKDKLQAEIDNAKKKPKKKGGFAQKLEQAMKAQQAAQEKKK